MPIKPLKSVVPTKAIGRVNAKLAAAQHAVEEYKKARDALEDLRAEFNQQYPDAAVFLRRVKEQEDAVVEQIKVASNAVRVADVSVGDFKLKPRNAQAQYAPDKVLEILLSLDDASLGETFKILVRRGAIKDVGIDLAAAPIVMQSDEGLFKLLQPAWVKETKMTSALSTPKFG